MSHPSATGETTTEDQHDLEERAATLQRELDALATATKQDVDTVAAAAKSELDALRDKMRAHMYQDVEDAGEDHDEP